MMPNRLNVGPRAPPGVHLVQFFTPEPFLTALGPENAPWRPKNAKSLPEPRASNLPILSCWSKPELGHLGPLALASLFFH